MYFEKYITHFLFQNRKSATPIFMISFLDSFKIQILNRELLNIFLKKISKNLIINIIESESLPFLAYF